MHVHVIILCVRVLVFCVHARILTHTPLYVIVSHVYISVCARRASVWAAAQQGHDGVVR